MLESQYPSNCLHFLQSEHIASPDGDPINRIINILISNHGSLVKSFSVDYVTSCLANSVLKEFKFGLVFNEMGNKYHNGALLHFSSWSAHIQFHIVS